MDIEEMQTTSVSKGVFVFKKNFRRPRKSKSKRMSLDYSSTNHDLFPHPWYKVYSELWKDLSVAIEELNTEMFASITEDLMEFVKNSYRNTVSEIPSAALLTGINMPDHDAQFADLKKQIKNLVSPHVACLCSIDCQNVKYLMENMINQFINEESSNYDEESDPDETKATFKKNQLSLSLLQSWYEDLYLIQDLTSPKKQKSKEHQKRLLVIIIPDIESFNSKVLQKFILIASSYLNILPFVFIFGVATSLSTLNTSLPYHVSSKISIKVFNSQPSTVYLNNILENVFFSMNCPFQLGGKVFSLFTDIFLFYDFSVHNFIQNIRYAMAEHFCYGNVMALCNLSRSEMKGVLRNFTHDDCESARQLRSFRKLVEKESYENRILLLTDDEYFKTELLTRAFDIQRYIKRLHIFLKCLHILVDDLPHNPLGKQLRELYAIAASQNITKTPQYKECFQLLNFQSKDELSEKLKKIVEHVSTYVNVNYKKKTQLLDFVNALTKFRCDMDDLENIVDSDMEAEDGNEQDDVVMGGQMDRKQLKEKLLSLAQQKSKPLNKYEKFRMKILKCLSETFEAFLYEPSALYFYEIFFYDDISIQNRIVGVHRTAIHNALNDPNFYLNCSCCEIPNDSAIRPTMPDICIAYKLHLECGKMINLYDWLQAFLSIVDPSEDEDAKRVVDPELQARFTQAVAELEYLGFIKSSKRKADHVARLTWGG